MTWTPPTHIVAGSDLDSAKFNEETVDDLLHIYESGAARAWASGATSISTAADTKIALATESYDDDGNIATSTYTCPRDGFLDVRARVSIDTSADGQRLLAKIYKNGAEASRGTDTVNGGTDNIGSICSDVLRVAAGDTIELYARLVGGAAQNCETGESITFMACRMVV